MKATKHGQGLPEFQRLDAPEENAKQPPRRILVMEDDDVLCRVSTEVLTAFGYNVDAAKEGAVAWAALQLFDYDLLITDYDMPNVSSVDLLKKLYAGRMSLPVILMSRTMPAAELEWQSWLQIEAMLIKPCTPAVLLATVRNALRATDDTADGSELFKQPTMKENKIQPAGESAAQTQVQANPPYRILVVDDESDSGQLSIDVLTSSGYDVVAVTDGAAGWEALQTHRYDLIVTDNKMPRMTGIEMIEKLRFASLGIPVIMATRFLPMDEFERKPWLTPDATLQRPFSNSDLLKAVKKVLSEANPATGGLPRVV